MRTGEFTTESTKVTETGILIFLSVLRVLCGEMSTLCAETRRHEVFRAASDDKFLCGGTEGREGK